MRGLDYYNRTVFEFEPVNAGGQSTLLAGGRYDPLIEILGGKPTPGIGFGSGIERIINELKSQEVIVPTPEPLTAVIVSLGAARLKAATLAASLRAKGIPVILAADRSFKAQMRYANQVSARYALILGERELESGQVNLKQLYGDGSQEQVDIESVASVLGG